MPAVEDALRLRGRCMTGGHATPCRTLLDIFTETADTFPAAVAIDDGETRIDYRGLAGRVARGARELRRVGIGPDDRVGVCSPSGKADLYIGILAVLASGAAAGGVTGSRVSPSHR